MWKVSIIITSYNHQNFIAQAIDSIFSQIYSNREILLGDDSPNDFTWIIIQEYIKKYPDKIKAWHHNPSKHITWNINFLLSQADPNSKYIAFLEWDDIWHKEYLSEKITIFKKYPNVWLVYNDLSLINEKWVIIEKSRINSRTRKRYQNESNTIWKLILNDMVCFSYSTLMSRNFDWIRIRNWWKTDLLWTESDFRLQIANRHNIYGIQKDLTLYRKHANNNSKDLEYTIEHYSFLINKYFEDGYVNISDYKKINIFINLMKSFNFIYKRKYCKSISFFIQCLHISVIHTAIIIANSIYYRICKPTLHKLYTILWKK